MTSMWIPPIVLERLAGSLLHFVWQGAAIALIAEAPAMKARIAGHPWTLEELFIAAE